MYVYSGLATVDAIRKEALGRLCTMLLHPFPKVCSKILCIGIFKRNAAKSSLHRFGIQLQMRFCWLLGNRGITLSGSTGPNQPSSSREMCKIYECAWGSQLDNSLWIADNTSSLYDRNKLRIPIKSNAPEYLHFKREAADSSLPWV